MKRKCNKAYCDYKKKIKKLKKSVDKVKQLW